MEMVSKLLRQNTKELGSFHVPFKYNLQKNIEIFSLTENVKELDGHFHVPFTHNM